MLRGGGALLGLSAFCSRGCGGPGGGGCLHALGLQRLDVARSLIALKGKMTVYLEISIIFDCMDIKFNGQTTAPLGVYPEVLWEDACPTILSFLRLSGTTLGHQHHDVGVYCRKGVQ